MDEVRVYAKDESIQIRNVSSGSTIIEIEGTRNGIEVIRKEIELQKIRKISSFNIIDFYQVSHPSSIDGIELLIGGLKIIASMAIDSLFWMGWAAIIFCSSKLIELFKITDSIDIFVLRFGQFTGALSMFILLISYTVKDLLAGYKYLTSIYEKYKEDSIEFNKSKGRIYKLIFDLIKYIRYEPSFRARHLGKFIDLHVERLIIILGIGLLAAFAIVLFSSAV